MNLVQLIMKLIGSGDVISRIASMLGIGQEQATKAVGAAVPSLLAGLIGSASKPEGAAQLAGLLQKQDTGLLDNLPNLLSQGASLGTGSSNPLSSLLGGAGLGQMASALSKFTGVGDSGTSKLLGMLSPLVLGAVAKQSKGLDAGGLVNMLMGQKANITSALPSGLGSMLAGAVPGLGSLLGSAGGAASSAANAAMNTASSAARATSDAAVTAARKTEAAGWSIMFWLIPLALLILAFLVLPKLLRKAPDAASAVQQGVSALTAEGTQFATGITGMLTDVGTTVASIKDEATAKAALPKLTEYTTKLNDMKALWSKLPASAQKTIGESLRPLIAKLRSALDPVMALPGVWPAIKPTVDDMLRSLDGYAASM